MFSDAWQRIERGQPGRQQLRVACRRARWAIRSPAKAIMPYSVSTRHDARDAELLADDRQDEVGVGLGQVEELLHRWPEPVARTGRPSRARSAPAPPGSRCVAGVRPRVQERRQARAAVGRADRVQRDEHAADAEDHRRGSASACPAATSIADVVKAITSAVPRSGCDAISRHAAPTISRERHQLLGLADDLRPLRDAAPRRVEHERELHQLRRLELQRPGAEPALRAVDRHADARELHQHEQAERNRQQRPGEAA